MDRVPLYVLNNFLRFDRKIYQVFGLRLGRPLRLKTILYFFLFGGLEAALYLVPVIGFPLRVLPASILFVTPALLAYLLSDVGTEGRLPAAYFRSFLAYQLRGMRRVTYRRGREIGKPGRYRMAGYAKIAEGGPGRYKGRSFAMRGYGTVSDPPGRKGE